MRIYLLTAPDRRTAYVPAFDERSARSMAALADDVSVPLATWTYYATAELIIVSNDPYPHVPDASHVTISAPFED